MSDKTTRLSPQEYILSKARQWKKWLKDHIKIRVVASNSILFLILTFLLLWFLYKNAPDAKNIPWIVIMMGTVASIVGVIFSVIAAWRSSAADKQAAQLLKELEETQRIVRESPSRYSEVFDLHLIYPMKRADNPTDKNDQLQRMDLLISTPAYGYHVLGMDRHLEFRRLLMNPHYDKQIILFSPDAHYFHIANTLLWHPLKQSRATHEKSNVSNVGTGAEPISRVSQSSDPDVNPTDLADCILRTMDTLRQQAQLTEQSLKYGGVGRYGNSKVSVWTTNTTEFRLSAFWFQAESLAYLVLTDQVTITSDLYHFRGRALSLPVLIHRQVFGNPGDPASFFEQLKTCPYSLETGEEARIRNGEFDLLIYDYLYLLTEHRLFDLQSFNNQCRQVIEIVTEPEGDDHRTTAARNILQGVIKYFLLLKTLNIVRPLNLPDLQQKRLSRIEEIADLLDDPSFMDVGRILNILHESTDEEAKDDPDPFWDELGKYERSIPDVLQELKTLNYWIASIYYFISSGFHQSLYAGTRRNRAKHLKALTGAQSGAQLLSSGSIPNTSIITPQLQEREREPLSVPQGQLNHQPGETLQPKRMTESPNMPSASPSQLQEEAITAPVQTSKERETGDYSSDELD